MSIKSPQEHRIVIIGGGIIGCTSAYYLTWHPRFIASNTHITVLEASSIAAGASGKAGGLVAVWAYPRELTEVSFAEHKKLADLHGGKDRWGWREVICGQWEGRARTGTEARGRGHRRTKARGASKLPDGLDWIDEGATESYEAIGGPQETAQLHPCEFTTSMLTLAQEKAGEKLEVIEGAKVVSINQGNAGRQHDNSQEGKGVTKGGSVAGVTYTTDGSNFVHIPADTVLLAAGPWSSTLLPSLPITASRAHSIVIEPASPLSPHVLFTSIQGRSHSDTGTPEIYPRPQNRVYACSSTDDEPLPELASQVKTSSTIISKLRAQVSSISAPIRDGKVEIQQACYLPVGGPIIGGVEGVQGLVIATGHTCWGICNAPGTGKAIAELIMNGSFGEEWLLGKLDPKWFLQYGSS